MGEQQQNIHSMNSLVYSAPGGGGGGTSYNCLYGEALPEKGTFFALQVYERVGISSVEVGDRVGKSVIYVFKRAFHQNISNTHT